MEVLRNQGKILYVGSSNFAGWHIAKAQEAARRRNFFGLVSEQSHYNLLTRKVELEVLPAAEDYGLGVIPWSPLASGLLGGIVRKEREGSRRYGANVQATLDARREQLGAYEDLCDELGEEPGAVGLAWLLTRPAVTGPIVGPRTPEHLESALHAVDVTLDDKVLARLDEIFPGYRTSPEDYAW
jgi:aryl-alcohol dehydrogenase-like predicted oxidoreductase